MYDVVITFGTYDLFHMGHLRILTRAKELGRKLVVGVSSDEFNKMKKDRYPIVSEEERMAIIKALKVVDEVFLEESMELKKHYIETFNAQCLVMGSDWEGRLDEFKTICDVVYLSRTEEISTTDRLLQIRSPKAKTNQTSLIDATYSYYGLSHENEYH